MPHYRIYFIGVSDRFEAVKEIEADNDTAVMRVAEELQDMTPIEVWLQDRRIGARRPK